MAQGEGEVYGKQARGGAKKGFEPLATGGRIPGLLVARRVFHTDDVIYIEGATTPAGALAGRKRQRGPHAGWLGPWAAGRIGEAFLMTYELRGIFHEIERELASAPSLRLLEIANRLRVSRSTVQRAVFLRTGETFENWRGRLLIGRAGELLGSMPSTSLKEIAATLGFDSARSFRRFIKTATRSSPTALRRVISARREATRAP